MNSINQDKVIIVDILCKAFEANTSVNYIVKQDSKRSWRIQKLMEYSFDICYQFGHVYLSSDKKACALILLPDHRKITIQTILLDIQFVWQVTGFAHLKRTINREVRIKEGHPATQSFVYVWFLGVEPSYQGTGKGSDLLTQVIDDATRTDKPIYLETSSPDSVRLY